MAREVDVYKLVAAFRDPDGTNPNRFGGVSYAPSTISRAFRTPEDVVLQIREAKAIRGLTDRDLLEETGLGEGSLARLTEKGQGRLDDFLSVLKVLGVWPVSIPNSIVLGR